MPSTTAAAFNVGLLVNEAVDLPQHGEPEASKITSPQSINAPVPEDITANQARPRAHSSRKPNRPQNITLAATPTLTNNTKHARTGEEVT